jgi:Putative auto-transporter adhesin, head GIN domain
MKQRTSSLLAIGILALALTSSTVYANNSANSTLNIRTYEENQTAKKVIISGNVEVTLVQDAESKKLYTNEGTAKARVYSTDDAIYVSSKKGGETAKITLYVGNISRIDIEGNAVVNTKNTLNLQYLQIILKDNAKADISSKTESLYTKLVNESSLKLNGTTGTHAISTNELATLNTKNFKAAKTEIENRNSADYAKAK